MSYAEKTTVSVAKSKAEIEDLITRYGAEAFGQATQNGRAMIVFKVMGRQVRFVLVIPSKDEQRFTHRKTKWGTEERTEIQALAEWEQEQRRLWRALLIVIKAKLEACASGIVTFEDEFMAHFVMPDGRTVGEELKPKILAMHESGKQAPLLLEGAQ